MTLLNSLKGKAEKLKQETYALVLAYQDPRTPWYARVWAALVVAYALSPIDLIPDFIPVLGYLDDLLLVPAGIFLAIRMIPPEVMQSARDRASQDFTKGKMSGTWGLIIVISIWTLGLALIIWLMVGMIHG